MSNKRLTVLESLRVVTQSIKDWVNTKINNMATGLIVVDNTLFLKTNDGYISEHGVALPQSNKPQCTNIVVLASGWQGTSSPYSQIVACDGVSENSKIDLQPAPSQVENLQKSKILLMATNSNGVVTVYAFNNKPTTDMTIQVQITEVTEI